MGEPRKKLMINSCSSLDQSCVPIPAANMVEMMT